MSVKFSEGGKAVFASFLVLFVVLGIIVQAGQPNQNSNQNGNRNTNNSNRNRGRNNRNRNRNRNMNG
ncbi:MAG: hypothetical protein WKF74_16430, partial [Pyrinomonadaceae bacterium]